MSKSLSQAMGRSDKPKFSTIFTSHWPDDGTDYDSDFADDRQPDISTDEESMMSGDAQVIAEGRASQAGDSDNESEDEAGEKGTAVANEDVAIHDSSGEERYDTSSLYIITITNIPSSQGQIRHSQRSPMSKLASCRDEFLSSGPPTYKVA